jgi:hypothetical protein
MLFSDATARFVGRLRAPVALEVADTPGSLLRVAIAAALFLALLGLAATPGRGWEEPTGSESRIVMTAPFGDPRGFRATTPARLADELRIAWIGGSSLLIHQAGSSERAFLPERVLDAIRAEAGESPRVLDYVLNAQRAFESWICTLDALRRDPDIVVVTLNPLFVYNTRAPLFRRWLLGAAAQRLVWAPRAWPELLAFAEPSDLAWASLSGVFPAVRDRAVLGGRFARVPELLRLRVVTHDQPLQFWEHAAQRRLGAPVLGWQEAALLRHQNTAPGSANDRLLDRLLGALADSGLPSLVYVAPVAPEVMADARMRAAVEAVEAQLAGKRARFNSPRLQIVSENPSHTLAGMRFADLVHLEDESGELPAWLAAQVLALREVSP